MAGSLLVAAALFGEGFSLGIDRYAAALIAAFIFMEAFNVFATVFRDVARKQEGSLSLHPVWLGALCRTILEGSGDCFYGTAARVLRIDPSASDRNERVGRVLCVLAALLVTSLLGTANEWPVLFGASCLFSTLGVYLVMIGFISDLALREDWKRFEPLLTRDEQTGVSVL